MRRIPLIVLLSLPWMLIEVTSCHGNEVNRHDYCIVGGGPAGLQMGYFLQKAGRDYVILERSNKSGSFFDLYPRHRKLISINKAHTGKVNKEFNLRHDWNSLLSDDETLLFKHFSDEYFPHADDLIRYLNAYREKLKLKVLLNTEVRNIQRLYTEYHQAGNNNHSSFQHHDFILDAKNGGRYFCRVLLAANGLWVPNNPSFPGSELAVGYENISTDVGDYVGKSVLILGRGNAAFETAESIYGHTNFVHMIGRSRVRLSWNTHYVGDLRGINNAFLDSYQLKSLDGLLEVPVQHIRLKKCREKIFVERPREVRTSEKDGSYVDLWDNFSLREGYDIVVRCLGFTYDDSLFHNSTKPHLGVARKRKYPSIKWNYESVNIPRLYFIGTAAHSLDFRKSSGGFIHGFRYTIRALHRMLEHRYHGVKWPSVWIPVTQLLNYFVKRMNEAAGIYQMFQNLGDVVIVKRDGTEVQIVQEFPVQLLPRFAEMTGHCASRIVVLVMEYGPRFSGPSRDTFREDRATDDVAAAHRSNFLHPVFYYYEQLPTEVDFARKSARATLPKPTRMHHILEDFLTFWASENTHVVPLRRFLENALDRDLRNFFAEDCMSLSLTNADVPSTCLANFLPLPRPHDFATFSPRF